MRFEEPGSNYKICKVLERLELSNSKSPYDVKNETRGQMNLTELTGVPRDASNP